MNIHTMHDTFRTIGQQMGMQLVRGILPASIDVYINEAIINKVRVILNENTNKQFADNFSIKENSVSPINALRTIYKNKKLTVEKSSDGVYISDGNITNLMQYISFNLIYPNSLFVGCRFIENDRLGETLRDYCNKPTWDYPIVVVTNNDSPIIEIHTNDSKIPDNIIVNYIENPAIVKWDEDERECVDCNLPEYLHHQIVEMAVNSFFQSVNNTK